MVFIIFVRDWASGIIIPRLNVLLLLLLSFFFVRSVGRSFRWLLLEWIGYIVQVKFLWKRNQIWFFDCCTCHIIFSFVVSVLCNFNHFIELIGHHVTTQRRRGTHQNEHFSSDKAAIRWSVFESNRRWADVYEEIRWIYVAERVDFSKWKLVIYETCGSFIIIIISGIATPRC